jgi:hypothetical protein
MTAREQRAAMAKMDGCKEYEASGSLISIEGHSHMNKIMEPGKAFRTGGMGMGDAHGANFGLPFFDTATQIGRMLVWYFPVASDPTDSSGDAEWSAITDCVGAKGGLHACTHIATLWANISSI